MAITLNSSATEPRLGARGNVIKLGTKKTGSHFANKKAPGLSAVCNLTPFGNNKNEANNAPHPKRLEGKLIANFCNVRRNAISRRTRMPTADKAFRVVCTEGVCSAASTVEALLLRRDMLVILRLWSSLYRSPVTAKGRDERACLPTWDELILSWNP